MTALATRQLKLAALLGAPRVAAPAPTRTRRVERAPDPVRVKPGSERPKLSADFGPTLEIKVLVVEKFARPGWAGAVLTFKGRQYKGPRGGLYYAGKVYRKGKYVGWANWYVSTLMPFTEGHRAEKLWVTLANTETPTRLGLKYEFVLER